MDENDPNTPNYWVGWWFNHTNLTNLRMTNDAIKFLKKHTKIPIYKFELPQPLTNKNLLQLSRIFTSPYHIQSLDKISLIGEEESIMLKLHADNLNQYLDTLEI